MKKTYQIEIEAPAVGTYTGDRLVDAICAHLQEALSVRSPLGDYRIGVEPVDGLDRCACGSKYWAEYKCIDCGDTFTVVSSD